MIGQLGHNNMINDTIIQTIELLIVYCLMDHWIMVESYWKMDLGIFKEDLNVDQNLS